MLISPLRVFPHHGLRRCPRDGYEMNGAKDTINMDDQNVRGLIIPNIWLNHPTACIFVGFGTYEGISLNECTRILLAAMQK